MSENLTAEELADLKAKAEKAQAIAPGTWEHDTEPGGGEYGFGPDTRSGYAAYMMMDDKGRRLFGSDGSEVAEIHEDGDDAWDENSRRVFDFLAAAKPQAILSLLTALEEAGTELERYRTNYDDLLRELSLTRARAEKAEQMAATDREVMKTALTVLCGMPQDNLNANFRRDIEIAAEGIRSRLSPSKSEADSHGR